MDAASRAECVAPMTDDFASPPCYAREFEHLLFGGPPPPDPLLVRTIAEHLTQVRGRIAAACARAGRAPASVRLLPVSKTIPAERLRAAVVAGCTELGENIVQEAERKARELADLSPRWVIIGHLQRNKAGAVARFAGEFQALDRLRLADTLQRRLELEDRTLDVLVQVNTSGEPSKFGVAPEAALPLLRMLPSYSRLRVRGLMTLAVFSADQDRVRDCFRRLRGLRDRLRDAAIDGVALDELSMGMSGDFEIAVEEGATTVRVGQAIFGPRALPDSHYWPDT